MVPRLLLYHNLRDLIPTMYAFSSSNTRSDDSRGRFAHAVVKNAFKRWISLVSPKKNFHFLQFPFARTKKSVLQLFFFFVFLGMAVTDDQYST